MKDRILIAVIAAVAVIAYILIPEIARLIVEWRRSRYKKLLRTKRHIRGTFASFSGGRLLISADDGSTIELTPRKTRFFIGHDGTAEYAGWRTISMLDAGYPAAIVLPEKWRRYAVCVFSEAEERDVALPSPATVKYASVAIGAFLEFLLLMYSLGYADGTPLAAALANFVDFGPSSNIVSLLALVAIFGKALPYCPPGLFLTLAAHLLTHGRGHKKSRGREAGGFLLISIGVALNVAVMLVVIGRIGFILP